MPTPSSFNAGVFTVSGFLTAATGAADESYDYNGVGGYTLVDFSQPGNVAGNATVVAGTDNYLFDGIGASESTSGHTWTLSVRIVNAAFMGGSAGGEEILEGGIGNQVAKDGSIDGIGAGGLGGTGVTFGGTGAASLAQQFKAISINLVNTNPGDYFAVEFTLTDVTASDTKVFTQYFGAPCFVTGTMIAVPAGETAVENLKIGDLVMTADGVAKPVKWIGTRSYTAAVVAANRYSQPVIIRKDAIAPAMPHRDMQISANHAVFMDDSFVLAAALVNGVTVLRRDELAPVAYYHIETDAHDVIFADGLPVETFVDDNSRSMFDNADEYYTLYGAEEGASFGANRLVEGVQLEAIRRRVAARAGIAAAPASHGQFLGNLERIEDGVLHGWAVDPNSSAAVELEVLVDGEVAGRVVANGYRIDLDHHGIGGGIGGFTLALPASVDSLAQVAVRRPGQPIAIRGRVEEAVH